MKHSELLVDEMNQKIESLQHEVASLQNALTEVNKSTLGNDTGYADYFGAVDSKDVEHQRNLMKRDEHNRKLQQELDKMNEKFEELQRERKEIDAQTSELLYENNELKDRMSEVEKSMVEQVRILYWPLNPLYYCFIMRYKGFTASPFSPLTNPVNPLKRADAKSNTVTDSISAQAIQASQRILQ